MAIIILRWFTLEYPLFHYLEEMVKVFDYLQIIIWSLTYLFIAICGFVYRKEKLFFMPLIAGGLTIAWEINALLKSQGFWGHIVWLSIDIVILLQNFYFLSSKRRRLTYGSFIIVAIVGLYLLFQVRLFDGMLISSFVIDLVIAVEYLVFMKRISPNMIALIAILRFLGDFFALIAYMRVNIVVCILGVAVAITNVIYIFRCFKSEEKYKRK